MKFEAIKVGEVHPAWRRGMPEMTEFNVSGGQYRFLFAMTEPTDKEIEAIKSAPCEFRFKTTQGGEVVWMLCKFSKVLPWSDAPYSWHMTHNKTGSDWLPDDIECDQYQLLQIVLLRQESGIIEAIRAVSMPARFVNGLNKAIRKQADMPFNQTSYDTALAMAYSRWPDGNDMAKRYTQRFRSERT